MPNGYVQLGAALGLVLALIGAYAFGRHDGKSIEVASQASASSVSSSVSKVLQGQINSLTADAQVSEQNRQQSVREIFHEKETVVQANPSVYTRQCVDSNGVRLIQKAADIANGISASGSSPVGSTSASSGATDDR
jgi:hypothetical protein